MEKMTKQIVTLLMLVPSVVMAHPGHGHENPLSPGHYLGNPEHAIPIALMVATVAVYSFLKWKKTTSKK